MIIREICHPWTVSQSKMFRTIFTFALLVAFSAFHFQDSVLALPTTPSQQTTVPAKATLAPEKNVTLAPRKYTTFTPNKDTRSPSSKSPPLPYIKYCSDPEDYELQYDVNGYIVVKMIGESNFVCFRNQLYPVECDYYITGRYSHANYENYCVVKHLSIQKIETGKLFPVQDPFTQARECDEDYPRRDENGEYETYYLANRQFAICYKYQLHRVKCTEIAPITDRRHPYCKVSDESIINVFAPNLLRNYH